MAAMELIGLFISAIAIGVVTILAIMDLVRGAPLGTTLKRWLYRVADAFFSA